MRGGEDCLFVDAANPGNLLDDEVMAPFRPRLAIPVEERDVGLEEA